MTTVIAASVGIPTAEPSPGPAGGGGGGGGPNKARLDAAHALLGVVAVSSSPTTTATTASTDDVADMAIDGGGDDDANRGEEKKEEWEVTLLRMRDDSSSAGAGLSLPMPVLKEPKKEEDAEKNVGDEENDRAPCALDALAMLASNAASMDCDAATTTKVETATTATGDEASDKADDAAAAAETWVRPPRRERSISNPEGMEKWDSLLRAGTGRVATIDEEEVMNMDDGGGSDPERERGRSASPLSSALLRRDGAKRKLPLKKRVNFRADAEGTPPASKSASSPEEDLDEMLRRARSKLLEDLVTGGAGGGEDGGGVVLPHALEKYQDIYNKNGRIGIYDPSERAAIIARFHGKRSRRVWNKRIRYSCRKNLADRRLRVKGRFVKRGEPGPGPGPAADGGGAKSPADGGVTSTSPPHDGSRSPSPTAGAASASPGAGAEVAPEDMPDTTDVEAGFCPTEDQPYRRTRRHTIT